MLGLVTPETPEAFRDATKWAGPRQATEETSGQVLDSSGDGDAGYREGKRSGVKDKSTEKGKHGQRQSSKLPRGKQKQGKRHRGVNPLRYPQATRSRRPTEATSWPVLNNSGNRDAG